MGNVQLAVDQLRTAVLNRVAAENSKRSYAPALDELAAFCGERQLPISRTLLLAFRAALLDKGLSASTVSVKLSAVRGLVDEAKRAGVLGAEAASHMTDIPNVPQRGTRLGNWLTKGQAKALLAVPDRSSMKGKRDYVILALLTGYALRRNELAMLDVDTIQLREGAGCWLTSKGREGASGPSPYRSGSSTASTPG